MKSRSLTSPARHSLYIFLPSPPCVLLSFGAEVALHQPLIYPLLWSMEESNDAPLFSCRNCRNPVALRHDLLSKSFIAKSGQAYMFAHAMNVVLGQTEDKKLMTGLFSIGNIYCSKCGQELGWKYIRAYDAKQSFKEGRFIIEKARILKEYGI